MISKTLTVLGATGSVGIQACDVAASLGWPVKMLCAGKNYAKMAQLARMLSPEICIMEDESAAAALRELLAGTGIAVDFGDEAILSYLRTSPADVTVHAIAGLAGTAAALAAASTPTRIAMANKEAVIAAGELIRDRLRLSGGEMIPVDSEHSAIFQCLTTEGAPTLFSASDRVSRIILTASGGPFFDMTREEMYSVTPEMALAHPTWKMGAKITVDCATMMNKGFEVIEASRFFGVSAEQIDVIVHRQSIIHSMVEYIDNTVIAQLGLPDMRSAVRYALTYPERAAVTGDRLNFAKIASLTFHEPDRKAFPLLDQATAALKRGGTAPAALIAADEVAVDAFLHGRISFGHISDIVVSTMEKIDIASEISEETLAHCDSIARSAASSITDSLA